MAEERKYRIRVDGILVDVSKEVYRAYYSIERHTRTLDEKEGMARSYIVTSTQMNCLVRI